MEIIYNKHLKLILSNKNSINIITMTEVHPMTTAIKQTDNSAGNTDSTSKPAIIAKQYLIPFIMVAALFPL